MNLNYSIIAESPYRDTVVIMAWATYCESCSTVSRVTLCPYAVERLYSSDKSNLPRERQLVVESHSHVFKYQSFELTFDPSCQLKASVSEHRGMRLNNLTIFLLDCTFICCKCSIITKEGHGHSQLHMIYLLLSNWYKTMTICYACIICFLSDN